MVFWWLTFSFAKSFDLLEFLKKENCALNIKYYPFKVAHKILFEENNGWMEKYHKDLVLKNTKLNPRKQDWFVCGVGVESKSPINGTISSVGSCYRPSEELLRRNHWGSKWK